LLFTNFFVVSAQENIPLEHWRMHISYNTILDVSLGDNKIFAASKNGIFYIDKTDNSINTISKINGLSDVGITAVEFIPHYNVLIIGYENGNIDVWQDGKIKNISTILKANLNESKRINHFNIHNEKCYISTDFGLLVFRLTDLTIEESIQGLGAIGESLVINESTIYNDSLFLATKKGVIAASLSPNVNILDFNNWKRYGAESNAPLGNIAAITIYNNEVVVAEQMGNIYSYSLNTWLLQPYSQNKEHNALFSNNTMLVISSPSEVTKFNGSVDVSITNTNTSIINDAVIDENNNVWVADNNKGLLTNKNGAFESILPEGPFSDKVSKLYYHENKIFALAGEIGVGRTFLQSNDGFYVFKNGNWDNFNALTHPLVSNNLVDITFNPSDGQYYLASFGSGILKYDGVEDFEVIDQTTAGSSLESWSVDSTYTLVSSIAASQDGVWAGNYGANNNAIHFFDNQQQWHSYSTSIIGSKLPMKITIAQNGDKWIQLDADQGGEVIVFNEKTGKNRRLTTEIGNGDLPQSDVYDIVMDKEEMVWIGTGKGVAYYSDTYSVENENAINAITPIIEGYPLLRDERITAIAIDGGNRKWFGTDNGLWLFDANTQKQIYFFTTENSPLLSNNILDIAIHDISGEVFVATDNGIVSFRSPATTGTISHENVKIFPNPVLASFEGLVGISGLSENATVKITDISGKLIHQMRANGATAGWNIKDTNGRRAATGIYLVFSASDDGAETYIGKIAVVE